MPYVILESGFFKARPCVSMCIGPSSLFVTDQIGKNQMCKRGIVWNLSGVPIFVVQKGLSGKHLLYVIRFATGWL